MAHNVVGKRARESTAKELVQEYLTTDHCSRVALLGRGRQRTAKVKLIQPLWVALISASTAHLYRSQSKDAAGNAVCFDYLLLKKACITLQAALCCTSCNIGDFAYHDRVGSDSYEWHVWWSAQWFLATGGVCQRFLVTQVRRAGK